MWSYMDPLHAEDTLLALLLGLIPRLCDIVPHVVSEASTAKLTTAHMVVIGPNRACMVRFTIGYYQPVLCDPIG